MAALLVAAPMVRCQADEADDDSSEPEIVAEPAAAKPPAGAASPMDQYKEMAMVYLEKATHIGRVYAAQAQELATKYLGQAQEMAAPYLEKAGIKSSKKTEL